VCLQREVAGRIDDEFCGWSLNVGIGGRYPLAAESVAVLDSSVPTSLGVVVHDNLTSLIVGTADGKLLKVCCVAQTFSWSCLSLSGGFKMGGGGDLR